MKHLTVLKTDSADKRASAPSTGETDVVSRFWRSLSEKNGDPSFAEAQAAEFPPDSHVPNEGLKRRTFLTVMGASIAMSAAACRRPEEKIVPFAKRPEEFIPGKPLFYATAAQLGGNTIGLLVESHDGRPTKIEGNPRHPDSLGGTTGFIQATVLDLYDPDRSKHPQKAGAESNWSEAEATLTTLGESLQKTQGKGLAVLTEGHRSPTLHRLLEELKSTMPEAKVFRFEPFTNDAERQGCALAFGQAVETVTEFSKAKVVVLLDSDALSTEGSSVRNARGLSATRDVDKLRGNISRVYAMESGPTVSGTMADHRLRIRSSHIPAVVVALANELTSKHGVEIEVPALNGHPALDAKATSYVQAIAKDLASNRGAGLVTAGRKQPAAVHGLVQLINLALDNVGKTVHHRAVLDPSPEGPLALAELTALIAAGAVETLVILGGNPAFTAPADVGFAGAMKQVKTSIHLSLDMNETSAAANWHLNGAHYLESWGDLRATSGVESVVQPLIAPLYDGKTAAEVVSYLLGVPRTAAELVQSTWRAKVGVGFEKGWRRVLHEGLYSDSQLTTDVPVKVDAAGLAEAFGKLAAPAAGTEITFEPDPHAWDGRFANNGWLQEMPDPMYRMAWDNAAAVSPATAKELGVVEGDLLTIEVGGKSVKVPALIQPGQADGSITLTVGQGRKTVGTVGSGIGYDVMPVRPLGGFYIAAGNVTRAGETADLCRTQSHFVMEGRPLIRVQSLEEQLKEPDAAKHQVKHPPLVNAWGDDPFVYNGHKWGMNIDLNKCVGCNACTLACQAENNGPILGREQVLKSREMHWIRIDRYFEGDENDPQSVVQPTLCNHCENAPCEQVCPVGATVHSPEGINEMVYNRCIGTKYCGNNCPYKVRRFNYLEYAADIPEVRQLQHNPDVTVRSRGVMEKCTWCVQRVNEAKMEAHKQGRDTVHDGEVLTACQQACPATAITFGDLNDAQSIVSKAAGSPRSYKLLEELNVRPRLTYSARVRNLNPELDKA